MGSSERTVISPAEPEEQHPVSRIMFSQNLFPGEGVGTEDCGRATEPFPTCFWGKMAYTLTSFSHSFCFCLFFVLPSPEVCRRSAGILCKPDTMNSAISQSSLVSHCQTHYSSRVVCLDLSLQDQQLIKMFAFYFQIKKQHNFIGKCQCIERQEICEARFLLHSGFDQEEFDKEGEFLCIRGPLDLKRVSGLL